LLWFLSMVATALDNPFMKEARTLEAGKVQMELNRHLEQLLAQAHAPAPSCMTPLEGTDSEGMDAVVKRGSYGTWQKSASRCVTDRSMSNGSSGGPSRIKSSRSNDLTPTTSAAGAKGAEGNLEPQQLQGEWQAIGPDVSGGPPRDSGPDPSTMPVAKVGGEQSTFFSSGAPPAHASMGGSAGGSSGHGGGHGSGVGGGRGSGGGGGGGAQRPLAPGGDGGGVSCTCSSGIVCVTCKANLASTQSVRDEVV